MTLHFTCARPSIRGPWSVCHHDRDKATWLRPHAASLMVTFTGQKISHEVTLFNNKSALVCQRTVANGNCLQLAYLSRWAVLWYTTASSDNNNGVVIHSRILFWVNITRQNWLSRVLLTSICLTDQACTWSVSTLLAFCFCYNHTTILSPMFSFTNTIFTGCFSNYFYLSTSNEIRSKYIDEGRLRWCFSEELSNTERNKAVPAWHKVLHCMSLSVTLIFLTVIIAAKAYVYRLIK